jgi:hypothetical protein
MEQLISGEILASEPAASGQTLRSFQTFAGLYANTKLLPDESKVLLLTHLYLELRLNRDQALRAARADIYEGA